MQFIKNHKKIFQIAGFLAAACLFGFFIYKTFFKPVGTVNIPEPTGTTTPGGKLPLADPGTGLLPGQTGTEIPGEFAHLEGASDVAHGGITKIESISPANGQGAMLSADGKTIQYYNRDDGRFYRVDDYGNLETLSEKVFHQVESIYWDPKGEKAILEYPDGANILYNFQTEDQATLPSHWKDFNFSPTGEKIVLKSLGLDENNRWLTVANPDGSSAQPVEALGNNEDRVYSSWSPNRQSVALFVDGVSFDQQKVYFVGLNKENFKALTIEGRGFQHLWNSKGDRLLYSVYSSSSDLKPVLWVANALGDSIGSGRKNLNIETWADKCVFADNESVYCAVPDLVPEGAGLMPELVSRTDRLYKVNTYTGQKTLVAIPEAPVSMSNLILTENGKGLFFSDQNGKIYKIRLE